MRSFFHEDDAFAAKGNFPVGGTSFFESNGNAWGSAVEVVDRVGLAKGGNGGGNGGGKPGGGGGGGGGNTPAPYTSGDPNVDDANEFNVTINFSGSLWTDALLEDFVAAADFLSSIITGDIADVRFRGTTIDDIVIEASIIDIDGPGAVLGRAGPTAVRTDTRLPATAIMEFDVADAADFDAAGLWDEIVLHEMMHSIGFGTIWDDLGLVDNFGGDLRFNGTNANAQFEAEFPTEFAASGGLGIFVETDGGPGTAGGHWDEDTFGGELMTGYIESSSNAMFVSDMTIAAFEDMGYETVWDGVA